MSTLSDRLFEEILQARQRVYAVGEPTPLQKLNLPAIHAPVYAKREDLGPIRAYKWRGAYNCMAALSQEARDKGIVAASAGNHAQGVALAASVLNCRATIFMPRSTPEVKQTEAMWKSSFTATAMTRPRTRPTNTRKRTGAPLSTPMTTWSRWADRERWRMK